MNANIQQIVSKSQTLKLKLNKGERYRIKKDRMYGSLWLMVQTNSYYLTLTGDVRSKLNSYVNSTAGKSSHEDQGRPVWYLPFDGTMEDIVRNLDRL